MAFIETRREESVVTITLNRPDKLNAFAGTMREELLQALDEASADPLCRSIVITGAGRAFCSGGDVEAMAALQRERNVEAFRKLLDAGAAIVTMIATTPKPVIAAINGVAAGAGCNLALACDFRIASAAAKLGETFVRIGLHPDWGGSWFLPRLVGRSRAFELLTSGRMIDAGEALEIGMVDRVVDGAQLGEEASRFARDLASGPPIAIAGIKRALRIDGLAEQLALEAEHQMQAFLSYDSAEGIAAFFEKRSPRFRGE